MMNGLAAQQSIFEWLKYKSSDERRENVLAKRKAQQLSRKLLKELPNKEDLTNQKSKI